MDISYNSSIMTERNEPSRIIYMDNLKWILVIFVVIFHAGVIYGPVGSFFYYDREYTDDMTNLILMLMVILLQSFFMGLFFIVSGYFVPRSFEKKGPRIFLRDRMFRLGVPALIFILILAPMIIYQLKIAGNEVFVSYYFRYVLDVSRWDTGPLWFAIALLIFSIFYILSIKIWRWDRFRCSLSKGHIWMIIVLVAIGSFIVRLVFPIGTNIWNMQLSFFVQYIVLFIFGILAYKNDWLAKITFEDGKYWWRTAVLSCFTLFLPSLILGGALDGDFEKYVGGLNWQAAILTLWGEIFAIGICIWFLVWFRERFNHQNNFMKKISNNAFSMYIFHAPILVGIAVIMTDISINHFLKFLILSSCGVILTLVLSEFIFKRIPVLKNII